ncbi:MAG: thioredoxin family protein [Bacteroidales bacterium]
MIRVIKNKDDFDEATGNPGVAIYFHSQACGVCNVLLPKLDELLKSDFPKIPLYVVNANESLELCAGLTVFSFPTILIYFEGRESLRLSRNINLVSLTKTLDRPYKLLFD